MILVLLCGLERAPTFLVPIINPPFADNSPPFNQPFFRRKKLDTPPETPYCSRIARPARALLFDSK